MTTSTIEIGTRDGPMPACRAEPSGDPRGAVVVVQEAFGLTRHIEDICGRIAERGWLSVAPALFHRQGSPVLGYEDYESVMPVMSQLSAEGISTDLSACLDQLAGEGFAAERCGIVGFCMGGTVTFFAAATWALGAAVSFYGGGVAEGRFGFPALVDLAPSLKTPWLGLYGDLDKGIPVEQVEALRKASSASPVETELVRYPDAEHGFNCNDRPAVYNPTAAADAWRRALEWFDGHLAA